MLRYGSLPTNYRISCIRQPAVGGVGGTSVASGSSRRAAGCPLCSMKETAQHFLLECRGTASIRNEWLAKTGYTSSGKEQDRDLGGQLLAVLQANPTSISSQVDPCQGSSIRVNALLRMWQLRCSAQHRK